VQFAESRTILTNVPAAGIDIAFDAREPGS
jgi:hypothetical protein